MKIIQIYTARRVVVFHFLASHQKVKRKIYSAISAPQAQRAVKILNRKESYRKVYYKKQSLLVLTV